MSSNLTASAKPRLERPNAPQPTAMFDRSARFNDLPPLPPAAEVETAVILKKAITASRALAKLKGIAERMPNQAMLIDSLVLQEARASSEIENILTTNDELFKAASDEALPASAEANEVLGYRHALNHGFRQIKARPLATGLFIEIAQIIKQTDFSVRRTPGTRIANSRNETVNILYLVDRGLLNLPVPYLSRYIIEHKLAYYEGLRRVTEEGAWGDWVLYMLDAMLLDAFCGGGRHG